MRFRNQRVSKLLPDHRFQILRTAVSKSRKALWTITVEVLALILSFVHSAHYAVCPMLVVAGDAVDRPGPADEAGV